MEAFLLPLVSLRILLLRLQMSTKCSFNAKLPTQLNQCTEAFLLPPVSLSIALLQLEMSTKCSFKHKITYRIKSMDGNTTYVSGF